MLEKIKKADIEKYVDSGQYFEDVRDWYIFKYVQPYATRAGLLICVLVMSLGVITMINLFEKESILRNFPFPIQAYDQVNYFPFIKPISITKEAIDVSIARYMSERYVKLREEYIPAKQVSDELEILNNQIRASSSKRVFSDYVLYMSPDSNPTSPVVKYKNQVKRKISVKGVQLIGGDRPDAAIVMFEAEEIFVDKREVSRWKAELSFNMSDSERVHDKKSDLFFKVTKYVTYKL
jgi:type IV secretory pathway component VirB8